METGDTLNEAKICKGCSREKVAIRKHVGQCAISATKIFSITGDLGYNPLDAILNEENMIARSTPINEMSSIIEYTPKCLGQSTHKGQRL